jgi:hypothetical protein
MKRCLTAALWIAAFLTFAGLPAGEAGFAQAREHPLRAIVGRELSAGLGVGLDKIRINLVGVDEFASGTLVMQEEVRSQKLAGRQSVKVSELVAQQQFAPDAIVGVEAFSSTGVVDAESTAKQKLAGRTSLAAEQVVGVETVKSQTLVSTEPSLWGPGE